MDTITPDLISDTGNRFDIASGTPTRLISRRPLPNDPGVFGLSVPISVRNASTWPWIAPALAPDAGKVIGAAAEAAGLRAIGKESAIAAAVAVRHLETIMPLLLTMTQARL